MSCQKYDDNCELCQPAITNAETGQKEAPDSPTMVALMKIWRGETTLPEREAYWRVMVQNSREPADVQVVGRIIGRLSAVMKQYAAEHNRGGPYTLAGEED